MYKNEANLADKTGQNWSWFKNYHHQKSGRDDAEIQFRRTSAEKANLCWKFSSYLCNIPDYFLLFTAMHLVTKLLWSNRDRYMVIQDAFPSSLFKPVIPHGHFLQSKKKQNLGYQVLHDSRITKHYLYNKSLSLVDSHSYSFSLFVCRVSRENWQHRLGEIPAHYYRVPQTPLPTLWELKHRAWKLLHSIGTLFFS